MIKLTEATYEELNVLNETVKQGIRTCSFGRTRQTLESWQIQILTAMQIVKDRETTNQN